MRFAGNTGCLREERINQLWVLYQNEKSLKFGAIAGERITCA